MLSATMLTNYYYAECRWVPICWVSLSAYMLSATMPTNYYYAECRWVPICWVSLCWVSLCWVSLCWVSRRLNFYLIKVNVTDWVVGESSNQIPHRKNFQILIHLNFPAGKSFLSVSRIWTSPGGVVKVLNDVILSDDFGKRDSSESKFVDGLVLRHFE